MAAGVTSFGASKALGKIFGGDEEQKPAPAPTAATPQQAPPSPYGQPYGPPNPYQQVPGPYPQAPAPYQQVPGAAGAMITAAAPATGPVAPTVDSESQGQGNFLESAGKVLLAAGAGGVGGFVLKNKEAQDEGLEGGAKFNEIAKGVLAGAGSGAFTKMGYDAIQEEGGGLKAGVNSGIAGILASTLKDGGPGLVSSFTTAFGAGAVSNLAHDKLEDNGSSKLADAVAGGGLATGLGYVGLGDGKAAGLLGLGGAGLGTGLGALEESGGVSGMLAEGNPLDKLSGLLGKDDAPQKDSGPELG
ncbi:MAG: hypothetical protein DI630_00545 [Gordonia sp. (in: high G+C Gram-positive bacteria)]|nr:MAG: hypothetical protein DI630_00545 [Gordonia sp. (in: high G+C Gram-positive bacteria)]